MSNGFVFPTRMNPPMPAEKDYSDFFPVIPPINAPQAIETAPDVGAVVRDLRGGDSLLGDGWLLDWQRAAHAYGLGDRGEQRSHIL